MRVDLNFNKMKIIKLISFLFLMPAIIQLSVLCVNAGGEHQHDEDIVITTTGSVDLGEVIKGMTKSNFIEEPIVKFEIKCSSNRKIRIIKFEDVQSRGITYTTEWKEGPYTGFEYPYSNGVYSTENKKFYITVKVKSITVSSTARAGIHNFSPSIMVELCDL
jgi:hypothetical protein